MQHVVVKEMRDPECEQRRPDNVGEKMRAGDHAPDAQEQAEPKPAREGRGRPAWVPTSQDPPPRAVQEPDRAVTTGKRGAAFAADQRRRYIMQRPAEFDDF